MAIVSDSDTLGGQPRIDGRRIPVSHVIANVEEIGVSEYCEDFEIKRDAVRDAIVYCMNQTCDTKAKSYCYGCRKDEPFRKDLWENAREAYQRFFTR